MFTKQVKINGEFVKGMIQNGVVHTSQLVVSKPGKPFTIKEITTIIHELACVKKEMEEN